MRAKRSDSSNDDDFEFPCVVHATATCPISADDIFSDGKIRPIFETPKTHPPTVSKPPVKSPTRRSLGCLFSEDKDFEQLSCSSSERDELDGVAIDTYCEWNPQKSNSKRWRLPKILRRCSSYSKDGLVFFGVLDDKVSGPKIAGKVDIATVLGHYSSNRAGKDMNHLKSYLPYKQDLIGLFANNINRSNKSAAKKWEPSRTLLI